ncbi:MAG: hypothetical protein MRZ61_11635 [Oscillospiraceae bacterium]|nr:hypothetical protein [Oscillospiraceae bacterium]
MRRKLLLSVLLCGIISVCLSGCVQKKEYPGSDKIEALRDNAASYDSARYFITNVESGVLEQVFTFMYDEDGSQIYLCEGVDSDGDYYAEYSNGREVFRTEKGIGSVIPSSDETFAVYTRKDPHPYSTGQLFFYVNAYIFSAEEGTDSEGNTLYFYNYDTEKINKALGNTLTEFATSYAFDGDGNFVYFRQHNASDVTEADGRMYNVGYTYEITVEEINNITEIENPVVISGNSGE